MLLSHHLHNALSTARSHTFFTPTVWKFLFMSHSLTVLLQDDFHDSRPHPGLKRHFSSALPQLSLPCLSLVREMRRISLHYLPVLWESRTTWAYTMSSAPLGYIGLDTGCNVMQLSACCIWDCVLFGIPFSILMSQPYHLALSRYVPQSCLHPYFINRKLLESQIS